MFRNDLDRIKEDIKLGFMYRDIDESYANGVWDLATNYVKNHYLNSQYPLKEQDIGLITNILYDFIYDLLDGELENE
jgi:hypothetical protein